MLKELELINFQGHIHSYLEFHKHLNIIRGTSNHGKSSIIRSILWALENEPYGINYLNWDVDEKEGVEAHLSFEGNVISRIKNSKHNGYLLNSENKFEALRSDVPEEIRAVSLMNKTNIRGQDDGYFMLQDSPGNVARMFNEKTGLADIDKVDKFSKIILGDFKNRLKYTLEELKENEKRRLYLLKVKSFEYQIHELDVLYEKFDKVEKDQNDLELILSNIDEIDVNLEICESILKRQEDLDVIVNLLDRRLKIASQYTKLRLSLNDIDMLETRIEHVLIEMEIAPIINDVNILILERETVTNNYSKLARIKNTIRELNHNIIMYEDSLESIAMTIEELNEQLCKIDRCPTCGAGKEHWQHALLDNR